MDYSWIDAHANKYAQALNGRIFTGVSCNSESINRTSRTEEGMVITLVISGEGTLICDGAEYDVHPSAVMFRHQNMDWSLSLSNRTFHRRCYLVLPKEVFTLLAEVHPALLSVPPVFEFGDMRKALDEFLIAYEHIRKSNDSNFFPVLPVIERYILYLASGFVLEGKANFLRRAKSQLESDYSSSLEEIAERFSMTYNTFRKYFTQTYGISPHQYRLHSKTEKAKQLLSMGYLCSEVSSMLDYPDLFSFSHQFKQIAGISPKDYRKAHIL